MEKIVDFHLDAEKQFGAPAVFSHRADLHEALRAKAISEDGPGIPIELVTKATVVSFEAHTGSVTLEDGSTLTADLVVAADGVHSKAHQYVLGFEFPPRPSKTTVIRFTVPSEIIRENPATAPLLADGNNRLRFYTISNSNRYLVQYPCRKCVMINQLPS